MRLTTQQLASALKGLRAGPGLSASKLAAAPALMRAFDVQDPVEMLDFMRDKTVQKGQSLQVRAARNALALGYDARSNLTGRRKWFMEQTHATETRTVMRWEDEGFDELSQLLVRLQPEESGGQVDELMRRLASVEEENLQLRVKTAELAECIGKILVRSMDNDRRVLHMLYSEADGELFDSLSEPVKKLRKTTEIGMRSVVGNIRFLSDEDLLSSFSKEPEAYWG